jgi:hypothetical protein
LTATPPEPPDETPAPAPPTLAAEGVVCPRCGTPSEPYQEYCLECGLRLPIPSGIIAVLSQQWQRRVPWYPGDWIWPVLLALVIAALAATGAILWDQRDNGDEAATPGVVATGPETLPGDTGAVEPPPPPTDTGGEPPPTGTDTQPIDPPPPPPPPAPTGPGGVVEWPPGQSGYTVVLASLPESSGRGPAVAAAQRAAQAGLSEVGVLNSSEYSSLHPGYWVVFSGIYDSIGEARSALDTARGSYPQAYTREITQ